MPPSPKRGIKRKRDVNQDNSTEYSKTIHTSQRIPPEEKFRSKLHHDIKEVKKTAKVAKARELQRTIKRLKTLRSKNGSSHEVEMLERQLAGFKTLDHELIACQILYRRLNKDKHVNGNEAAKKALEDALKPIIDLSGNPSTTNGDSVISVLESRLCSSKALAKEVGDVVERLRAILLPQENVIKQTPNVEMEMKGVELSEDDEGWESGSIVEGPSTSSRPPKSPKRTAIKEPSDVSPSEATSSGGIGDSANEEDEVIHSGDSHSDSLAASAEDVDTPMADSGAYSSSFLPSLAVGYTEGDSDASSWSDEDDPKGGQIDIAPRKNRRGQRARKAIWAKKYGKNANHLKNEQTESVTKAAPKVSVTSRKGQKSNAYNVPVSKPWTNPSKTNAKMLHKTEPKAKAEDKQREAPLHPSWEAAKRRKTQPMILPSAGKKIVF